MMNPKKVWTCIGAQTKVNSKAWANMKCHTKNKINMEIKGEIRSKRRENITRLITRLV
jgi:hypothetical protein